MAHLSPERIAIARTVAANVRAEVARHRITQPQIADLLGITQSAVSRRLRGYTPFSLDELALVACLLGLRTTDLIPCDHERQPAIEAVA